MTEPETVEPVATANVSGTLVTAKDGEVLMDRLMSNTRITELAAVATRMVEMYKKATGTPAADVFLGKAFRTIEEQNNQLIVAIRQSKAISDLDERDTERDGYWRAVSHIIRGYENMPVEAQRLAATRLRAVFDKYGLRAAYANYAAESALVESFLRDVAAGDFPADISALPGLGDTVSALRTAQTEFVKARIQYEAEIANGAVSASTLKPKVAATINSRIVPYIQALAAEDGYTNFAASIAQAIQDSNVMVGKRGKDRNLNPTPVTPVDDTTAASK